MKNRSKTAIIAILALAPVLILGLVYITATPSSQPPVDGASREQGPNHSASAEAPSGHPELEAGINPSVLGQEVKDPSLASSGGEQSLAIKERPEAKSLRDEYRRHATTTASDVASSSPETAISDVAADTPASSQVGGTGPRIHSLSAESEPPLQLPAAILEPDPSIPITTEWQVAEWERLQDEFVSQVDGRAPADAGTRERWIKAQQESDDKFRAKFGVEAFLRQQMRAYREGLAPGPPP